MQAVKREAINPRFREYPQTKAEFNPMAEVKSKLRLKQLQFIESEKQQQRHSQSALFRFFQKLRDKLNTEKEDDENGKARRFFIFAFLSKLFGSGKVSNKKKLIKLRTPTSIEDASIEFSAFSSNASQSMLSMNSSCKDLLQRSRTSRSLQSYKTSPARISAPATLKSSSSKASLESCVFDGIKQLNSEIKYRRYKTEVFEDLYGDDEDNWSDFEDEDDDDDDESIDSNVKETWQPLPAL